MDNTTNNLVLHELNQAQYTSDRLKSYLENNSFYISECNDDYDSNICYGQHLTKRYMYIGDNFKLSYPTDKLIFCIDIDIDINVERIEAELTIIIKGNSDNQFASISHSFIGGQQRWIMLELNNMNNKFESSEINDYLSNEINKNSINLSRCENVKIILKNCSIRMFYQHYWQIKYYPFGASRYYDNENDS